MTSDARTSLTDATATRVVCILPRLADKIGGGKVNAIFRRMNLLADRAKTGVTLLNVTHSCNQNIAFAELVANGILDPRIEHRSLFEFCHPPDFSQTTAPKLPDWDRQKCKQAKSQEIVYFNGKTPVMRDQLKATTAGQVTVRTIKTAHRRSRLKYLDGRLIEQRDEISEDETHFIPFANGAACCRVRYRNKIFAAVTDFRLGQTFRNEAIYHRALVERLFPQDCVVFIDGITTAYLSPAIHAPKALFLHADHRRTNGSVLKRSRSRIDAFDGDVIVTATNVQKRRLEADTRHSAPIRVIPHYTTVTPKPTDPRAHVCTVSRLDLTGKPIHHCIEAFTRIMHLIPDCDYRIYGSGRGQARLQQLIDHHACGDRVRLMGPTDDPGQVFSQALFSLAPTLSEGFGLTLLESLTCGCPVISYDVDYGPRELVLPRRNGELVAPGDIDALAQAILKLHRHHEHYAASCKATAEAYSLDAYKARYHALIDDLAGRDYRFDISAPDLCAETQRALETAPMRYRERLLDLLVQLSEQRRDLGAMYEAFRGKQALLPNDPRPVIRCVWLSRRLGRLQDCHAHLTHLERRFPDDHAALVARHPAFLELADAAEIAR
ncbi:glycosyltransferase [Marivita sp.]|uniref:glycosyltransferase n=1 Tax=Marivita sp. TaxID=2003365 RepID=UPI0025C2185B|nr:glycosyltransferase [Marivita sp.]